MDRRADVVPEARQRQLGAARAATDFFLALDHQHACACARERDRRGEPVRARANDHGYGSVFERPIEMWAEPRDLVVTVSSSGQSENIIRALRMARQKKCELITFSGFSPDNPSRALGDLNFYVSSSIYGYVETAHMSLIHYLTGGATKKILASKEDVRFFQSPCNKQRADLGEELIRQYIQL